MLTQIINGKIFTPQGWLDEGSVLMRDNKILEVTNCDLALIGANLIDAKGMYIVPGFVCMHAHGAVVMILQSARKRHSAQLSKHIRDTVPPVFSRHCHLLLFQRFVKL